MQVSESLALIIKGNDINFTSQIDIKNFIKELTKDKTTSLFYCSQGKMNLNQVILSYNKMNIDDFYFVFYFVFDSFLITNILKEYDNRIYCILSEDVFESFKNKISKEDLILNIENLMNDRNLILKNYNDCDADLKSRIDKSLVESLNQYEQKANIGGIIQSEKPNTLYHITRLNKKRFFK